MKKKKEIWLGSTDFREIIRGGGYYVDKTRFLDDLFRERGIKVKLFTRPRRFGKTLNMSMIRHFFDIRTADENRDLFKGLDIEKTETMKEFGQYPVIFLTFKDIDEKTARENIENLCSMISNLYGQNSFVKEVLMEDELMEYEAISLRKEANYKLALRNLIKYLHRYYGKEAILLIDEYDIPLMKAYVHGYYEEVIDFYQGMFRAAFKDTEGLKFGILTGIMRIARENIFSGLNNIAVYSVLGKKYPDFFGFTEEEVEQSLKDYEMEDSLEDVRKWYNGYSFNGKAIYNPWSIMYYLMNRELKPYWINTSGNDLIKDSLKRFRDRETLETLEDLFGGNPVTAVIDESIVFKDLKTSNRLWNLMLNSGYLTVNKEIESRNFDVYELRIPNYEIETFFRRMFIEQFLTEDTEKFDILVRGLEVGRTDEFERKLKDFIYSTVSFSEKDREGLAHGIMIGITASLRHSHYTKSEREAGYGKFDVYIEPKDRNGYGYIIETKVVRNTGSGEDIEERLKKEAGLAVGQIRRNAYYAELMERDIKNVSLIGIAFCGKRVEMSIEKAR